MPAPRQIHAAVALLSFAAAAAAGWFSARAPEPESAGVAVAIAGKDKAPRGAAPAVVQTPGAFLAGLERNLAFTLDSRAETRFSGERLLELARGGSLNPSPWMHPAFLYARRWAQQAPQEMFDWIQAQDRFDRAMGGFFSKTTLFNTLFTAWGRTDTNKALAAALQCRSMSDRSGALAAIIEGLRKTDPSRAAAVAAEHFAMIAREKQQGWNAYNNANWKEMWSFMHMLPPGKDRSALLARYFDEICRFQTADSVQLWNEAPEDVRREVVAGGYSGMNGMEGVADMQRALLEQGGDGKIASSHPATGTLDWAANPPREPSLSAAFLAGGARDWAGRDPAAAIAWAQQHLKGRQRVEGTAQLFSAAAVENFDATLHAWQALPDGILRARAAGHLAAAAPAARKAEVDVLLESLSPADRGIAHTTRQSAAQLLRLREARAGVLRRRTSGASP